MFEGDGIDLVAPLAGAKALDLTQDELAQRVGCSLNLIQKIEADARRPSREIAARLTDRLELAADERAHSSRRRAPS